MGDAGRNNGNDFLYEDNMTINSRRHTEPDTHLRQKDSNTPASLHPNLHRAITYDRWSDQHRRLAALQPMVEYVCDDDRIDNSQKVTEPRDQSARLTAVEDEEAPMIIPAGYHYKGDNSNTSSTKKVNTQIGDRKADDSVSAHQSDMIHKIAAFVLSKAGAQGQPNEKTKHLIDELAAQILEAIKTDSWDHVPKELLREVKSALK